MNKKIVLAVILVVVIILGAFFYSLRNDEITGRAIITQEEESNKGSSESSICSSGCNQENIIQVCSNGKWVSCAGEKVCSLGECVTPEKIQTKTSTNSAGGIGGDSGSNGGGVSIEGTTRTIYDVGEVETEITFNMQKGNIAAFEFNGKDYTIDLLNNNEVQTEIKVGSQTFTIKVGNSQKIDLDSDENPDVLVKVKSINVISNVVTLIVRI